MVLPPSIWKRVLAVPVKELFKLQYLFNGNLRDETKMEINGYKLKITCKACPEQYDVFKNGTQVAYLRLRHGFFYASVPDCSDNIVYEAAPIGDGMFEDSERMKYLTEAIIAVEEYNEQFNPNNL